MRDSISSFEQSVTFPYSGKVFTIESKISEQGNYNSLTASPFERYLISSDDDDDQYILKMIDMKGSNKLQSSFDEEDDEQILTEYKVLKLINKHPHTLQCLGKVNIIDKYQCIRTSIILQKVSQGNLENYLDTNLGKFENQTLLDLSYSLIESFLSFEKENITFSDEINLSYLGVEKNYILIVNGFSFCQIHEQPLRDIEKESYIYKKNCAQIKAIVFGLLLSNRDLLKKYVTPTNLQQSLDKIISQNKAFQSLISNYPQFDKIVKEASLYSLKSFVQYLVNLKESTFFDLSIRSDDQLTRQKTIKMEKLQKTPSQIFKVFIQSEMTEPSCIDQQHIQYNIETIMEAEEDNQNQKQSENIAYNIIDLEQDQQNNNQSSYVPPPPPPPLASQARKSKTQAQIGNPQKISKNVLFTQIEMQTTQQKQTQNEQERNIQNTFSVQDISQNALGIRSHQQSRSSFNSQPSNMSESFKRKAERLKEEENEDISQKIKHKQKQSGDFQRRKQELKNAKQIEEQNKQKELQKHISDEENNCKSGNSENAQESENAKAESLSDNLLISKSLENTSLISDANVVKIMIGLLILFIAGGIIFGTVFNFGVNKSNSDEPITCTDTNCQNCQLNENECNLCKSGYQLDFYQLKCINVCTVEQCGVCINNYKICEQCQSGYTLYQNKCIPNSQSCPITNCSTCSNLQCTECQFGYRLYNASCIKKCTSTVCLECDSLTPSNCTKCEPPFNLNTSTNKCS